MSRRTTIAVLGATVALVLAGCGGDSGGDESTGETRNELRVAMAVMPKGPSLDPMLTTYGNPEMANLYDGLTAIDADGQLVPGLATEWEAVDPTTWRFTSGSASACAGGASAMMRPS